MPFIELAENVFWYSLDKSMNLISILAVLDNQGAYGVKLDLKFTVGKEPHSKSFAFLLYPISRSVQS